MAQFEALEKNNTSKELQAFIDVPLEHYYKAGS